MVSINAILFAKNVAINDLINNNEEIIKKECPNCKNDYNITNYINEELPDILVMCFSNKENCILKDYKNILKINEESYNIISFIANVEI